MLVGGAAVTSLLVGEAVRYWSYDAMCARRLRRVRVYPVKDFPDCAEGAVLGVIQVGSDGFLEAPVSGRRCVAYELVVESKGDDHYVGWGTLHREARVASAVLVADGCRAYISATAAAAGLGLRFSTFNTGEGKDGAILRLLLDRGLAKQQLPGFPIRIREAVVEAGDRVLIAALGRWESDPAPEKPSMYREIAKRLVLEPANPTTPMLFASPSTE